MYDDAYNQKIANTVLNRSQRKALNVDRLNGSGTSGGQDAEKRVPAATLYRQQNSVFEDDVKRNLVIPKSVVEERAKYDLGSGKYSGGSGMVGFPERAPLSAVEPQSVVRERAGLDLGAGRSGAGSKDLTAMASTKAIKKAAKLYGAKKISKGELTKLIRHALPHGMKGKAAQFSKAICGDMASSRKRGKGKSFEEEDDDSDESEMEGSGMPLHMSGCGDFEQEAAERKVGGKACCARCKCKCGKGRSGSGMSMGAGMSGGYGPVAPTTESLYGYDNRAQSKGLMPPPSVNQQPGMCGSGASGGVKTRSGKNTDTKGMCSFNAKVCRGNVKYGGAMQPVSMQELGRSLIPRDQLPSGIGGARAEGGGFLDSFKSYMNSPDVKQRVIAFGDKFKQGGAMFEKMGEPEVVPLGQKMKRGRGNLDNYAASSSGSIIPELQSRKSNIGSGSRSARGAMVSKLMKEHGMSLGEASRYLKENKGAGVGNS